MRFAVLGGDRRSAILCRLLLEDGHKLSSFALEKAALPEEIPRAGCLQSALYGADCVILPVPAERGGLLNTPLSSETIAMKELIPSLWKGQLLIGGKLSEGSCVEALRQGVGVEELMNRPDFVIGNAALTAEGAVGKLISGSEKSILGSEILICGWGRIGRILALRLKAMGANVAVCARRSSHRAEAEALGIKTFGYGSLEGRAGDFDFIVNTVPEQVITKAALCCMKSDVLLLELASPPGGFDRSLAGNIGLDAIAAPGLPGKCAPYAGALLMKKAIYAAIEEQEE